MNEILSAFRKPENLREISHDREVLFLGSCFSENIATKMSAAGFKNRSNPFGVIFHPIPLAKFIIDSLTPVDRERTIQREDVFLSLDAASSVYAMSEPVLLDKLKSVRTDFRKRLKNASTLCVTFGSAHGYRFVDDNKIVANCHKLPGTQFNKELTEKERMAELWLQALQLLRKENPDLQVIFTISPVRYSRDGWVENNRSKARLMELCNELEITSGSHYFPAYEIVNDLLRDHRYFEKDTVHPNELAIDEVWKVFADWYFSADTKKVIREVSRLRQMESHRLLFPESVSSSKFREKFLKEKESFLHENPQIVW